MHLHSHIGIRHSSSDDSYSCADELNAQEWEDLRNVGNGISVANLGEKMIKTVGDDFEKRALNSNQLTTPDNEDHIDAFFFPLPLSFPPLSSSFIFSLFRYFHRDSACSRSMHV